MKKYLTQRKNLNTFSKSGKNGSGAIFRLAPMTLFTPLVYLLQCEQMGPRPLFMSLFGSYLFSGFVFIACLYFLVFRSAHDQMKSMISAYPHVQNTNEMGLVLDTCISPVSKPELYVFKPTKNVRVLNSFGEVEPTETNDFLCFDEILNSGRLLLFEVLSY